MMTCSAVLAQLCFPLGEAAPGGQSAPLCALAHTECETGTAPSAEIYFAAQTVEKWA